MADNQADRTALSLLRHVFSPEIEDAMSVLTLDNDTLTKFAGDRIGRSEADKKEVQAWSTSSSDLLQLNTHLAKQVYLVGNDWTVCDLLVYARLVATVTSWDVKRQCEYCHITRWFDHIQHLRPVASFEALPEVPLSLNFDKDVTVLVKAVKIAEKDNTPKDNTKDKKDKKDKDSKVKEKKEEELTPALISFKVGLIQKAILHPDAESLYVSTVDLGESEPRTVVSGLVRYISLEAMQGRRVVCVCNLKPASMRGIKSSAMVLAASPKTGKDHVELVEPPATSQPGDVLTFSGFDGVPEAQLNPKKKIFETIQPGFTTSQDRKVIYVKGDATAPLANQKGEACTVESLVSASIR